MEFASKLFDMIYEMVDSRPPAFSELSKSKQSISSDIGSDNEETEISTPTWNAYDGRRFCECHVL